MSGHCGLPCTLSHLASPLLSGIDFSRGSEGSYNVQDAIDAVVTVVGRERAQRLWGPFLAEQAEQPVKLQWLPLLACWLTSPSPPSYADLEADAAAQTAESGAAASRVSDLPSPGTTPASAAGAAAHPETYSASTLARPGRGSSHAPNGTQVAAKGGALKDSQKGRQRPAQPVPEMSLDQHAEQAFQLQEAAMRVGYAAAALPLWEHFLWRFFSHQVLSNSQCVCLLRAFGLLDLKAGTSVLDRDAARRGGPPS